MDEGSAIHTGKRSAFSPALHVARGAYVTRLDERNERTRRQDWVGSALEASRNERGWQDIPSPNDDGMHCMALMISSNVVSNLAILTVAAGLIGCRVASPAAECRAREARQYNPGPIEIVEKDPMIVRTIRCSGAYPSESECSDDAPKALKFSVMTKQGPPQCDMLHVGRTCWWENRPGASHGDAPGSVDMSGMFAFSSLAIGGSTQVIAHLGVASDIATVRVRLFLSENPGRIASDVITRLHSAPDPGGHIKVIAPLDGAVWATDQGDGKPPPIPTLDFEDSITAAWVHIENRSRSMVYDGTYASAPIVFSRASWDAICRSTEQNEALEVRLVALAGERIAQTTEQRWRIDHGRFYHSPESRAQEAEEEASNKAQLEKFEKAWIASHVYIPRSEAVEKAIQYVRDQGYTAAPPVGRIRYDIVDIGSEAEVLANRRGSLDPKPVGTLKKAGWWWVAFRSVRGDACRVRVVAVSFDGRRRRMLHQDLLLGRFDDL